MLLRTSEVPISSITVGRRFRKDLGNIKELMESIKEVGLLHPVVLNEHKELVAGKRRLVACKKLGWKTIKAHSINIAEIVRGEFHENKFRKDFTVSELVEIKKYIEKTRIGHRPKKGVVNDSPFPRGKTRDVMAKSLGMSSRTIQKAEHIVKAARSNPKYRQLLEKVDRGKVSIDYANKKITSDERRSVIVELPDGIYNVLYADPPWRYNVALRADPEDHYNTMLKEDLIKLGISSITAKDAVMFMWATNPMLPDALDILDAWGFTYQTNMVWVKQKYGIGHYVRGRHELLLIATKGKIGTPAEEDRPDSVIMADATDHSKKPLIYDMIEDMYPNKSYVELFARNKPYNNKWEVWGDQIEAEAK